MEQQAQSPDVDQVVDALVDPMVEFLRDEGESGRRFLRFLARLQSDRCQVHHALQERHFPDVRQRMAHYLTQACPHLPMPELKRRITMTIDAMLQSLANADFMSEQWGGLRHEALLAEFVGTLKAFLTGGLAAPVSGGSANANGPKSSANDTPRGNAHARQRRQSKQTPPKQQRAKHMRAKQPRAK
jgi:Tetracyclin repressor-like, C-terminal domain